MLDCEVRHRLVCFLVFTIDGVIVMMMVFSRWKGRCSLLVLLCCGLVFMMLCCGARGREKVASAGGWITSQRSGHAALLFFKERDRAGDRTRRGQCTVKWGSLKNEEPKARMEPRADEREPRAEGSTAFTPPEAAVARAKEKPRFRGRPAPPERRAVSGD